MFLAHLVDQPKSLIQSCLVHHRLWRQHLCTPPPGTWLDTETSYLVYICTHAPIYAHKIFNGSDLQFLNGSHFSLICYPAYMGSHRLHMTSLLYLNTKKK